MFWWYRKFCASGVGRRRIVRDRAVPVLGLLEMSYARCSLVADHLQYPGMPGIIALAGGSLGLAWSKAWQKRSTGIQMAVAAMTSGIVLTLGVLTWRQATLYRSEISLWTHAITLNDGVGSP